MTKLVNHFYSCRAAYATSAVLTAITGVGLATLTALGTHPAGVIAIGMFLGSILGPIVCAVTFHEPRGFRVAALSGAVIGGGLATAATLTI